MSKDAVAVALVHDVVLERSASAIYVARRDDRTLFVAGPNFTDAAPSCFRHVLIGAVLELDHSLAEVAGLSVGSCAFRQHRSDPWTHGTIPNGPTFLVTYEARPNEFNLDAAELGGAFVDCWIVADTLESALCTAVDEVTAAGWEIVERTAAEVVAAAECASDPYFRQAQIDGIVLVVHSFPKHELDLS